MSGDPITHLNASLEGRYRIESDSAKAGVTPSGHSLSSENTRMSRYFTACFLILLASLASGQAISAQEADDGATYGLKAGLFSPGCVYVDDSDCFDASVSFSIGGFVDTRLGEKLLGGVSLDLNNVESADSDFEEILLDVAVNLKADLSDPSSSVRFRPGIGFGYARASVDDETLQALTIRALVEALFPSESGRTWIAELGVYAAPAGGTECCDVTWGPGVHLRGGLIF